MRPARPTWVGLVGEKERWTSAVRGLGRELDKKGFYPSPLTPTTPRPIDPLTTSPGLWAVGVVGLAGADGAGTGR